MQKLVRRTILAQKQAARRVRKGSQKTDRQEMTKLVEQQRFHRRDEISQIRKARAAQREDWELGPLRPKRDVGSEKEAYATMNSMRSQGPTLTKSQQLEAKDWIRGIKVGDMVMVVEGREKGKVGRLLQRDFERGEAKVEDVNMVDFEIPRWMLVNEQEEDQRVVRSMEKPVPFSSIRLVLTIQDNNETDNLKDFVCEKVHVGKGGERWVIMPDGEQVFIPRSRSDDKPEDSRPIKEDTPADTLRLEMEEKTFVPTLLRPPMPGSVIDELRNKYSIFRTRHDPEYIAAKMQEDKEAEARKSLSKKMRTPLNEINRLERKLKKAKGKGKLTDQMLERIGMVIASKRQLQLDAASVEGESEVLLA